MGFAIRKYMGGNKSMQTYNEALAVLSGRESRKLENNTYLKKRDTGIAVQLHATDVVFYQPDGKTLLFSGGWRTLTTKDRINTYSPVRISQNKGVWYVGGKLFHDGMTVFPDGTTDAKEETKEDTKAVRALKKKIRGYAKGFVDALHAGKVGKPSNGDCWYCLMRATDGRTLGDIAGNESHYAQHIEEKYFVPSLLVNALEYRSSIAVKQTAQAYMEGKTEYAYSKERDSFIFEQMENEIYRHVKKAYNLA